MQNRFMTWTDNELLQSSLFSSDVTWCASEFELTTDMWANDFDSDVTNPDDAEPFYDMDRQ